LAYADWSANGYEGFHDAAFIEIFNNLDFGYMSDEQVERAEELFEAGWLNLNISEEERRAFRQDFSNFTNYELSSEEWEIYRELYDQTNG
jgi:hypothetical protein